MSMLQPFVGKFITPEGQPLVLDKPVNGLVLDYAADKYSINGGGVLSETAQNVTRASSKHVYQPVNGEMLLVEIPPNTKARRFDPVTGIPLGLSVEGSATNLVKTNTDPVDGSYNWLFPNYTKAIASPAHGLQFNRFTWTGGDNSLSSSGSNNLVWYNQVAPSGNYRKSIIIRQGNTSGIFLNFPFGGGGRVGFDFNTETFYVSGIASDANHKKLSAGVFEISFSVAPTSTSHYIWIGATNDPSASFPRTNNGFYFDYAIMQYEAGTEQTSWIITGASTITRDADVVTSDAATFGDWYRTSGTLTVKAKADVGDIVARLGSVTITADVDTEKEYSVTYTTDPLATELELMPSGNGYIKQVTFKE